MQKLSFNQISSVKKLLKENNLPVSDLNDSITFFAKIEHNTLLAVGGIEKAGKDAIIRSIAVSENYKGKGFGKKITRELLNYAREKKVRDVYLLTTTADNYFTRFGFKKADRASLPAEIKNSSQYSTVCPDTAVVMKLDSLKLNEIY